MRESQTLQSIAGVRIDISSRVPAHPPFERKGKMSLEQGLEMARCVEINIDNMVKMMPILAKHPLLEVVKVQIKDCIKELEHG